MYVNAEYALSALASGRPVGRAVAIVAALELRPLAEVPGASIDVRHAYDSLQRAAEGDETNPGVGRRRLAQLAGMVREFRIDREQLLAIAQPAEPNWLATASVTDKLPVPVDETSAHA